MNRYIDHTLLRAESTASQVEKLCQEAKEHQFATVCVNPSFVAQCAELLKDESNVKVCSVVGFPLGAVLTEVKVYETQLVIGQGATEVDMVIHVGAIKSQNWKLAESDVQAVVQAAHAEGSEIVVKVILETCLLTDDEKVRACQICRAAGADFVKTSTGFSTGGATIKDVALMRRTVGPEMGVKASGGVRTLHDAQRMIQAGATRIGASAGVEIMKEAMSSGREAVVGGNADPAVANSLY